MSAAEIAALLRAAREARVARAGVWGFLADTLRRVSIRLTFRGKGAPVRPDEGLVLLPKLFRRLAMWRVNRRAKMCSEALGSYLSQKRIVCFETREFLAQGVAAMPRDFAEFIGRDGRILAGPEELVFKEDPSALLVAGGGGPSGNVAMIGDEYWDLFSFGNLLVGSSAGKSSWQRRPLCASCEGHT